VEYPLQDLTNQRERQMQTKRVLFLPKRAATLNWFVLATQICQLKKTNLREGRAFGLGTSAKPQKTNSRPDIGRVKHGDGMKALDVLKELEKHEAECLLRYKNIEEKLNDQKSTLKLLDVKVWGIAVLVLVVPFAAKLLG
jgi:hypothetical protein